MFWKATAARRKEEMGSATTRARAALPVPFHWVLHSRPLALSTFDHSCRRRSSPYAAGLPFLAAPYLWLNNPFPLEPPLARLHLDDGRQSIGGWKPTVRFLCVSGKWFGISAPNCLMGLDGEETLTPPGRPSLARSPDSLFFLSSCNLAGFGYRHDSSSFAFPTARAVGQGGRTGRIGRRRAPDTRPRLEKAARMAEWRLETG